MLSNLCGPNAFPLPTAYSGTPASPGSGSTLKVARHRRPGMANGTVKFFNASKGFGFIAPDDGGADVFVHASALERAGIRGLNEGDLVSFEVEEDRRSGKVSATNLQVTGTGSGSSGRSSQRPRDDYGSQG